MTPGRQESMVLKSGGVLLIAREALQAASIMDIGSRARSQHELPQTSLHRHWQAKGIGLFCQLDTFEEEQIKLT